MYDGMETIKLQTRCAYSYTVAGPSQWARASTVAYAVHLLCL